MTDKILCKKCEVTKTRTDYHIHKDTQKGKCNRCSDKLEDDD
jgi:uncharacterized paraquat-inducible protein A